MRPLHSPPFRRSSCPPRRPTTPPPHPGPRFAAQAAETGPARKPAEFIAYLAAVLAVAVTALMVGDDGENTADPFSTEQALRYITFLTIGYMIARGLAKWHPLAPRRPQRLTGRHHWMLPDTSRHQEGRRGPLGPRRRGASSWRAPFSPRLPTHLTLPAPGSPLCRRPTTARREDGESMETQTTAPQTPADRAGTVGNETKQATKDVAATAGQEAKQVTREAKDQVRQLWGQTRSDLTDQASTQQTRAASGLRELADQLGQMAGAADHDGMAEGSSRTSPAAPDDAAPWLDQRDPGSLLEEARSFARQRPGTFLAIAAGVGVLAGRLSRGLVDEAATPTPPRPGTGSPADQRSLGATYATAGTARRSGGYGTGSLGATGSTGGTGIPDRHEPDDVTDRVDADHARGCPAAVARAGDRAVRRPARAPPDHPAPRPRRHAQPIDGDGHLAGTTPADR